MNKVKLVLTFVIIIGIVVIGLYCLDMYASKSKSDKLDQINKNYGYSKGIIMRKRSYKGRSIEVKYQIGSKEYNYHGGWDHDPYSLREGDSITFRYALDAPELIITALDNDY
ncbi:hypothetical protein [Chitinophaga nivalis]|uniref:DUF3592 domain-containing protein n=1 Tax=Chitinophaga nivalis TaxID=2991709 RepID=A0ABT3IEI6_9BACT|nr:hypothetical protein [Chitinophaga nivalis]MCW3467939.1 hypothetical protein [Chitinophaga nivalis]MCW3482370.1 hypothetical protein [Chitinophaga nivalis]